MLDLIRECYNDKEKEQFDFTRGLNDEINEISDRYAFWIELNVDESADNYIVLYDYSLEERIFDLPWTIGKSYARIFLDGFLLGRNTKG